MKKRLLFITVIALMIGMCGCMDNNKSSIIADQARTYLREKYDQDFQTISIIDKSIDVPFEELCFRPDNYPEEVVTVYRYKSKDGEGHYFTDDFYRVIIRDDYKTKIQTIIDGKLKRNIFCFNFTASYFPDELDVSYGLDKALENFHVSLFANIYVFVPQNENGITENTGDALENEFRNNSIDCYFAIYEVDNSSFDSLTEENCKSYLSDHYELKPVCKRTVK